MADSCPPAAKSEWDAAQMGDDWCWTSCTGGVDTDEDDMSASGEFLEQIILKYRKFDENNN